VEVVQEEDLLPILVVMVQMVDQAEAVVTELLVPLIQQEQVILLQ
jgi:hypothetical protein